MFRQLLALLRARYPLKQMYDKLIEMIGNGQRMFETTR
jgi:hypothetical protein